MPKKIEQKQATFISLVDLGVMTAASKDNKLPIEIPILPKGEFMTLPYGNMVLDTNVFEQMIGNFKGKVRRAVPLDVDHAANGSTKAAGWIEDLFVKDDGLWAKVEYTPYGAQLVGDKEYRMISAEWSFDYVDPQKSTHHGAVLVAATLTNRPLMQSMPTITASDKDLTNTEGLVILFNNASKKDKTMPTLTDILAKPVAERTEEDVKFLEENAKDLTDEQKAQVETEVKEAEEAKAKAEAEAKEKEESEAKVKEEAEAEAKEAAEKEDAEACKAALIRAGQSEEEAMTAAEKMVADVKAAKENVTVTAAELQRLQKIESDMKAAEVQKAAEDFSSPFMASEKGGKVAPAGKDALLKLASSLSEDQRALLASVLKATAEQKITGAVGKDNEAGLTADEQYNKLVSEYMEKGKTASEANRLVRKEHKEVYEAFIAENK